MFAKKSTRMFRRPSFHPGIGQSGAPGPEV